MFRLSMGSAYAGLGLLCTSLILGPLNVLRGRPNPVSFNLRRDVGIWAAILGLFHVAVGLQVHMRGRMWPYFLERLPSASDPLPLRLDLFGVTNHAGLIATLVLVLLLGLSNDVSLRRLGPRRWKALQRWNYLGFVLVAGHGAAYQVIEGRSPPLVGVFVAMLLVVVLVQVAAYRARRLRAR